MKKVLTTAGMTAFFLFPGLIAFADNWNNLTNPNDVPPAEIISDMAKVAIGVTIVGAAILIAGRRGAEITAEFEVTDATYVTDGSIRINFSGGTGPFTVTGISPTGEYEISSTGNSVEINNVEPGEYEISFVDSKGNSFKAKTSVGGAQQEGASGANPGDFL